MEEMMKERKMELEKSPKKKNLKHFKKRISNWTRNHQWTQSSVKMSQNVLELLVLCLL